MAKKRFTERAGAWPMANERPTSPSAAACSTSPAGSGAIHWLSTGISFPEGFLQERWGDDGKRSEFDGKPNAIALKFGPKTRKQLVKGKKVDVPVIERFTITDDLEGVSALVKASIAENAPVYMAPVSWYARNNKAANARFLHAFAVDLDGMTLGKLRQRAQADAQRPRPRQREVGFDAAGLLHRHERAGAAPVLSARPPRSAHPRRRALPAAAEAQAHRRGVDRLHQRGWQQGQAVPGGSTRASACPARRPG